ncbi:unnamed protein product [Musa acuminata subsp. burmannicoides]
MERFPLIDVPSEDDRVSSSSSCDVSVHQSTSVIAGSEYGKSQEKMSKQMKQTLQPVESSEQKQSKTSKHYLRNSLDWDRDFLTSEGVLNNEELAIINSTFKKSEACSLPIITEEAKNTTELNSYLDNDRWALEKLEVDLFKNVQTSNQKTPGTGEKALKLAHPSKKINPAKGRALPNKSPVKSEPSRHNKKKSPVTSERHGVSNHLRKHDSRGATVVTDVAVDGITSSRTVSKPTRVLSRATVQMVPAKTTLVPAKTQIRTSNTKEKPGNVVMPKSVVVSKKMNEGSSSGNSKSSQPSKTTSTLVRNSVDKNLKSPSDITRMSSTSRATSRSSSGLITNIASMRTSRTKTVGRSASNSTVSSNSAVKLTSSTPSSSFDSAASGSFSSTRFAVKSAINSIETGSPSLSLESADNDRVHSAGCSSCLRSEDHGDQSSKLHATKNTPDDEVTSKPSRGDHPRSSTNNNSATKCCRSPVKKPLTTQTSKQPSFLKATTGASKTDSVNKLKHDTIQHTTPGTRNRALNSGSSQTHSAALTRNRKHRSQSLEKLPKLAE